MISSIITFLTSLLLLKVTDRVYAFLTVHFFCLLWNLFFRFLIIQFSKTFSRSLISVRWVALLVYHIRFGLSSPFFHPGQAPASLPFYWKLWYINTFASLLSSLFSTFFNKKAAFFRRLMWDSFVIIPPSFSIVKHLSKIFPKKCEQQKNPMLLPINSSRF